MLLEDAAEPGSTLHPDRSSAALQGSGCTHLPCSSTRHEPQAQQGHSREGRPLGAPEEGQAHRLPHPGSCCSTQGAACTWNSRHDTRMCSTHGDFRADGALNGPGYIKADRPSPVWQPGCLQLVCTPQPEGALPPGKALGPMSRRGCHGGARPSGLTAGLCWTLGGTRSPWSWAPQWWPHLRHMGAWRGPPCLSWALWGHVTAHVPSLPEGCSQAHTCPVCARRSGRQPSADEGREGHVVRASVHTGKSLWVVTHLWTVCP